MLREQRLHGFRRAASARARSGSSSSSARRARERPSSPARSAALPGFVDLSEVTPHKAAIPDAGRSFPRTRRPCGSGACSSGCGWLALVPGWRGVEQTPETAFVLGAALRAYPKARAVHVIRDGRDVVCSLLERGWLSAGRGGRRRREGSRTASRGPLLGRARPARGVRVRERCDPRGVGVAPLRRRRRVPRRAERTLEVRYESIAASPERPPADRRSPRSRPGAAGGGARAVPRPLDRPLSATISAPEQLADVEREAGPLLRGARLRPVAVRPRSYRSLRPLLGASLILGRSTQAPDDSKGGEDAADTDSPVLVGRRGSRSPARLRRHGVRGARPRKVRRAARLRASRAARPGPRRRMGFGLGGPGIGFGGPGMMGGMGRGMGGPGGPVARVAAARSSPTS